LSERAVRWGRLFRGLHECIGEIVDVLIHDERGHRSIQPLLERFRSSSAERASISFESEPVTLSDLYALLEVLTAGPSDWRTLLRRAGRD
jgi:hypothetical protein